MCMNSGLLIGFDYDAKRAIVARANCDQWTCKECSARMASRWILRAGMGTRALLGQGDTVDFVTITSHEKLKTFADTERVWRSAWSTLYAALKRKKKALQFFTVPEKHKDGRMHVHSLWNANVSQTWLKNNARKRGLGYQAKVIHVTDASRVASYVGKYVGKDLGADVPKGFRRVRTSQNWIDIPAPNNGLMGLTWEYVTSNGALEIIYLECQAKRITLVDYETGEIWDDIDLGTTVSSQISKIYKEGRGLS